MLMLCIGVFTALGNYFLVAGTTLDKAGRVAGLSFLRIVIAYAEDALLFGYSLNWLEAAGAAIVVVCSITTFLLKVYGIVA
jgi:drug/metabolite transporter (DMT)-like permease